MLNQTTNVRIPLSVDATILLLAAFMMVAGCAFFSDHGVRFTKRQLKLAELPALVRDSIESEHIEKKITKIVEVQGPGLPYYQLIFDDGTETRYNPDGSKAHRGIL